MGSNRCYQATPLCRKQYTRGAYECEALPLREATGRKVVEKNPSGTEFDCQADGRNLAGP